jgi:hypothetical protein
MAEVIVHIMSLSGTEHVFNEIDMPLVRRAEQTSASECVEACETRATSEHVTRSHALALSFDFREIMGFDVQGHTS